MQFGIILSPPVPSLKYPDENPATQPRVLSGGVFHSQIHGDKEKQLCSILKQMEGNSSIFRFTLCVIESLITTSSIHLNSRAEQGRSASK